MEIICNHEGKKNSIGLCRNCYRKWKYHNDEEYREKIKKKTKKYMKKYYKKHKNWNRERQINYRKNYPEKYNYIMCKHYFKKLNEELRKKLFDEFYGQERGTNQA